MNMFPFIKRAPRAESALRSSANEFALLRAAGTSDAEALRILFDMITTNGPVPEIVGMEGRRAS